MGVFGVGARIGRYRVQHALGQGGMGTVYAAYDSELQRPVALKLVRSDLASSRAEDRRRLMREARALAALSHPNIVSIYDVTTHEGQVVLAMELIEGQTLRSWLKKPRSGAEILAVFVAAGRGLAEAHAAGIIHRDFKPSNVLITDGGDVKVLDFGLARADSSETSRDSASGSSGAPSSGGLSSFEATVTQGLTETGTVMGTPLYMSPEQRHAGLLDARSDQYSFCVALWQALYGSHPYPGDSAQQLAEMAARGQIMPPTDPSNAPRHVRRALERGLSPRPSERFESMDELLGVLQPQTSSSSSRWWVLSFAAVAVVLGAIAIPGARPPAGDDCASGGERWAQVWSELRRERSRQAFTDAGGASGIATWIQAAEGLDRYGERWAAQFDEACRTAQSLGADTTVDRRVVCLQRGREQVGRLAELWEHADEITIRNAVAAIRELPSPEVCDRADNDPFVVDDPADQARVDETLAQLAVVDAHLQAGSYRKALKLAQKLDPRARTLGYPALQAEVAFAVGRALARLERFDDAIARLQEAEYLAQASGHDERVPEIIDALVYLLGYKLGRTDEALEWGRKGLAAASRVSRPKLARGKLLNSIGNAQRLEGDYPLALETFEEARSLLTESCEAPCPDVARAWNNVANAHYMMSEVDEAAEAYEKAASLWVEALGPTHPDTVIPLANLAPIYGRAGDYEKSTETAKRVLDVWTAAYGPTYSQLSIPLGSLAEDLRQLGRYDEAIVYDQQALALYERTLGPDEPISTGPMYGLGMSYYFTDRFEEAQQYFERVLVIREGAYGSDDPRLALTLCKLALCELELGDPQQALQYAQRALDIGEATSEPDSPARARFHYTMATVLLDMDRYEEAIEHLERTLELRSGPTRYHPDEVAGPKFDLAMALHALGRDPARVRTLAEEAAKDYEAWNESLAPEAAEIRAWLAGVRGS